MADAPKKELKPRKRSLRNKLVSVATGGGTALSGFLVALEKMEKVPHGTAELVAQGGILLAFLLNNVVKK